MAAPTPPCSEEPTLATRRPRENRLRNPPRVGTEPPDLCLRVNHASPLAVPCTWLRPWAAQSRDVTLCSALTHGTVRQRHSYCPSPHVTNADQGAYQISFRGHSWPRPGEKPRSPRPGGEESKAEGCRRKRGARSRKRSGEGQDWFVSAVLFLRLCKGKRT